MQTRRVAGLAGVTAVLSLAVMAPGVTAYAATPTAGTASSCPGASGSASAPLVDPESEQTDPESQQANLVAGNGPSQPSKGDPESAEAGDPEAVAADAASGTGQEGCTAQPPQVLAFTGAPSGWLTTTGIASIGAGVALTVIGRRRRYVR